MIKGSGGVTRHRIHRIEEKMFACKSHRYEYVTKKVQGSSTHKLQQPQPSYFYYIKPLEGCSSIIVYEHFVGFSELSSQSRQNHLISRYKKHGSHCFVSTYLSRIGCEDVILVGQYIDADIEWLDLRRGIDFKDAWADRQVPPTQKARRGSLVCVSLVRR